jgi:hypothetical protein
LFLFLARFGFPPRCQLVRQPACPARTWHLEMSDVPTFAPRRGFLATPDRCSGRRQTLSPAKPASRNGLSLAHSGCPFTGPPLRGQRSRPASSTPRCTGLEPVRLEAPFLVIRCPNPGEAQRLKPVARAICPALHAAIRALLPVGIVRSLRLVAWPGSPRGKLASTEHPISVHSPPTLAFD